jgi:hypothetical protein
VKYLRHLSIDFFINFLSIDFQPRAEYTGAADPVCSVDIWIPFSLIYSKES